MTLIAIDAGHGYETAGKRSPDGMREYAFNRAAAKECILHLEKASIQTIQLHDDALDVPLAQRTNRANQAGAHYYISIHANAFGNGSWNAASGIETYIHSVKGEKALKLAQIIHSSLIKKTGSKDRGVKKQDFHVLRETNMPAVLIECGFMTNKEEKALLASPAFRAKCGKIIAEAIIAFLDAGQPSHKKSLPKEQPLYRVQTGVFTTRARAEELVKKLRSAGFDAAIGIINK
ncbi:N-acetylmuramoyl-L-alanine amidase [Jeotgalibacillus sp. S-D1]|uniref:N-acetylmuramoyl-L-alanine amidase n=1 Tax=Jeotgalibacillus sp. S-D1 TaxID=2552189 RepID=UPI00105A781E|nr:N-acetylmuramoyl-L-alanine amidase [Jeotgalibacillus sp. S-D1]TDL32556.1 N-acetylmuramoyl-L-alanine amidase [Jeotgalibacillus sp. S-D1]